MKAINTHLDQIIAIGIIIIDQLTKLILTKRNYIIIPKVLSINYCENYGAAWNLFNNQVIFLIIISIIALAFLLKYQKTFLLNIRNKIAFGLVFGGLLGNLIDRIFWGYVRDFISVIVFEYNFPIFNIADMAIVLGMGLILIAVLKKEDKHKDGNKSCNGRR